jgi:hypothetical protein
MARLCCTISRRFSVVIDVIEAINGAVGVDMAEWSAKKVN